MKPMPKHISDFEYHILINGELIYKTAMLGLAQMKFDSIKNFPNYEFMAELRKVYIGENFDPVLHSMQILDTNNVKPPCKKQCAYLKRDNFFHTHTRPTAFRCEVMPPEDRCGWLLKPSCVGGNFFDYAPCICPNK